MTRTAVDLHPHRGSGPIDPSPGEPPERLTVKPWWDSRLALVGVRPDDPYVERFWLAIVGPSAFGYPVEPVLCGGPPHPTR